MADEAPQTPEQTDTPVGGSFVKRELSGATFLTLEHIGHMALVVVVAILLAMGVVTALNMWMGNTSPVAASPLSDSIISTAATQLSALWAVGLVAALVVLVPLLVLLDRRTRAEWVKRPGYTSRVAYKVPVYTAIAAVTILSVGAFISMLVVVLSSLALIGVVGSDIGAMYLTQFIPALVGFIVFTLTWWYLFKLAKGHDYGRTFSLVGGGLGVLLAIALFITAVVALHNPPASTTPSDRDDTSDFWDRYNEDSRKNLEDLFNN
ncbi:MAG: hypothetical protein ACREGJ_02295 [Candidatus Saccharimonadales bacterium]